MKRILGLSVLFVVPILAACASAGHARETLTASETAASRAASPSVSSGVPATSGDGTTPTPPSQAIIAQLSSILELNATAMGDGSPTVMEAVQTDLRTAEGLADAGGNPSDYPQTPVYLLYAQGNFTGAAEKVPAGSSPRGGSMMTVVLDAASLKTAGLTVGDTAINLASVGPIISLLPPK